MTNIVAVVPATATAASHLVWLTGGVTVVHRSYALKYKSIFGAVRPATESGLMSS